MTYTLLNQNDMTPSLRRLLQNKAMNMFKGDEYEVYPGLTQADAIMGTRDVISDISDHVGSSVLAALTDMSMVKTPLGVWADSSISLEAKQLNATPEDSYIDCIRMVARWFGEAQNKNKIKNPYVIIKKDSNIGYPDYTTSNKARIENFREGLRMYSGRKDMPKKGCTGTRVQPEVLIIGESGRLVGKPRPVIYPVDIYNEIKHIFPKTMEFQHQGSYVYSTTPIVAKEPYIQRAKGRQIIALSYLDNSFPITMRQLLVNPHWVSEVIYVHRTEEAIFAKIRGKYLICLDFSNYDRTVVPKEIECIFEEWRNQFPLLGEQFDMVNELIMKLTLTQFDLILPPVSKKTEVFYYEAQADRSGIHGIISGIGITDVIGKIIGTAFCIWLLRQIGYKIDTVAEAEEYLLNMGDDNVITVKEKEDIHRVEELCIAQKMKDVKIEDPPKFLGKLLKTGEQKEAIAVCAALSSLVVNSLAPEYPAGHRFRKYSVYGLEDRIKIAEGKWYDDKSGRLATHFIDKLRKLIPDYNNVLEEETELAHQQGEIEVLLKKYNLKKFEEIFYIISLQDLEREDAEMIGILMPFDELIKDIPQIKHYI